MDPAQLGQILANLCVNARDAIAGVGTVVLETGQSSFDEEFCAHQSAYHPGDYVYLAVTDDGSGMDAETLAQIFEPFFTTKELGRGTGLGLATIYGIVQQNGGFTTAYSEPGIGSSIKIYLPRHGAAPESAPRADVAEANARSGAAILVVEDEPAILALAAKYLEGQGYLVLAAGSPDDALRLAKEYSGVIDLLLTDVIMPEMNGRALADRLVPDRPHLKVLYMSGYTADVIADRGLVDQDASFISKPFHLKDLAAKVRDVLNA
jgi:CheY-like chemotaxis protein